MDYDYGALYEAIFAGATVEQSVGIPRDLAWASMDWIEKLLKLDHLQGDGYDRINFSLRSQWIDGSLAEIWDNSYSKFSE